MSGANASMSGHMTITSRGSSVGSFGEDVQDRVADHLDLAGAAVAGVDLHAAASTAPGPRAGRSLADGGLEAGEQRVAAAPRPGARAGRRPAPSDQLQLARVLPPGGEQPVARQPRGGVVGAARRPRPPPREALPQRRRGVQQEEVHVAVLGQRPQHVEVAGREAREPEERQPRRQVRRAPARPAAARTPASSRSAGLGHADPRAQPPPQLGLPVASCTGRPLRGRAPAGAARSGRTAPARWRTRAEAPRGRSRCSASGASHASPRHASTTSSSGHTSRSGSHGSASGSIPEAAATASPISRRGNGNSTLAHTPSIRPALAPSEPDSRCVSQRSMPRVGTDDDLGGERIRERRGQQVAQRVDQCVGPFRSVDVQHAPATLGSRGMNHAHPARHLLRAKDLIDAATSSPSTCRALARAARLSPAHFSREFRRAFGETPHQYLLTRRLERAAALLRNTDSQRGRDLLRPSG